MYLLMDLHTTDSCTHKTPTNYEHEYMHTYAHKHVPLNTYKTTTNCTHTQGLDGSGNVFACMHTMKRRDRLIECINANSCQRVHT